jgi:LysR family transcriptional regulator, regulator for bpeEF and oprC
MDLELTRVFVKVIQHGSFSRAALALRVPKSTVSKYLSRLEAVTGTKLLLRTTRSLTLTAAGRAFYDSCLGPIQTLEDAQKSLYGQDSVLSGMVRITAPEDLGSQVVAPAVGELVKKHAGLNFELHYTDEVIDLVKDGFDLAIRIGSLNESNLRVKKIGEITLVLVASPAYLKTAEKIGNLSDLEHHVCLALGQGGKKWTLKSEKKGSQSFKFPVRVQSNQMTSLLNVAMSGAGVALVPEYLSRPLVEEGRLQWVLPEWRSSGLPVSMVSPLAAASSARLKVTSGFLFEALQKALQLKKSRLVS